MPPNRRYRNIPSRRMVVIFPVRSFHGPSVAIAVFVSRPSVFPQRLFPTSRCPESSFRSKHHHYIEESSVFTRRLLRRSRRTFYTTLRVRSSTGNRRFKTHSIKMEKAGIKSDPVPLFCTSFRLPVIWVSDFACVAILDCAPGSTGTFVSMCSHVVSPQPGKDISDT